MFFPADISLQGKILSSRERDRTMSKAGMSEFALARCRKMVVYDESDDQKYLKRIVVIDPRLEDRVLANHVVRTKQDYSRVTRSYMSKYRIPHQNVITSEEPYVLSK
jgi:hypothetical protein